ncbi:MAG: NTP transferase domain-containing protein [Oscillospiraceae bacterium]|nr:NTP transferase domain-containing protein [Oscillospiraceae bacterium]
MINDLKVIILAAGRGTRLNSKEAKIPKHMREAAGKPVLYYVLKSVDFINDKKDIIIIVGYMKEIIMKTFPEYTFVVQNIEKGYGTGAATKCAEEAVGEFSGNIFILQGDAPLITSETLLNMRNEHIKNKNDCTILSCEINEVLNLGRIIRGKNGNFCEIVENRDCTDEQRKIKEYNASVMLADSKKLFEQLKNLKNNNKSGEYYLTDIPKLFLDNNYKVGIYKSTNDVEIYGADSIEDLTRIENILKNNSAK